MFLEQFSDLFKLYVSCDRLFVVGDLNVHFDKPSDSSTSALNVVLDNLSLYQFVKIPTHRHGHILDWLITGVLSVVRFLALKKYAHNYYNYYCLYVFVRFKPEMDDYTKLYATKG